MSTDIAASPIGSGALISGRRSTVINTTLQQVRAFMAQPAVVRSLPAISMIMLVGLAALVWMALSSPPQRDLFRGLPDGEKASVVEALRGAGIDHAIDRDTGALSVSESDYHQARMLLASQGLPKSAPGGDELIASLPLGASRAVEGERLRAAREMDLARTIEAIDAIRHARVHLAMETPSAFVRDRPNGAASVMLTLNPGGTLSEQQVQAIVHLVASSVPGLAPDRVSVADHNGRLLSSEGNGGATDATERQVAVQSKIQDRYRRSIESLLTPILGVGNFTSQVHADVDFSETQATREGFPKDASTIRTEEGQVSLDGEGANETAGGIPGALSNQPPAPAEVADAPGGVLTPETPEAPGAAAAARRSENYVRSFAVGREVSVTRQQTGQVKRLTVAVALKNPEGGKPRTQQEIAALEALVKSAVGFDAERGDVVTLSARSFAPVEEVGQSWWETPWVPVLARNLTALAVALLLVFGLGKPLSRRAIAALGKRAEARAGRRSAVGSEIAAAIADQASANPDARVTLEMIEAAASYEARAALIRNFVRQDPARAALVVRDLIRNDRQDGDDRNV